MSGWGCRHLEHRWGKRFSTQSEDIVRFFRSAFLPHKHTHTQSKHSFYSNSFWFASTYHFSFVGGPNGKVLAAAFASHVPNAGAFFWVFFFWLKAIFRLPRCRYMWMLNAIAIFSPLQTDKRIRVDENDASHRISGCTIQICEMKRRSETANKRIDNLSMFVELF